MRRRALAVIVAACIALGSAGVAVAVTRMRALSPTSNVCLTESVKVGVRDRSGKRRSYRISVINPAGVRIFSRSGRAPKRWKTWLVTPAQTGRHRVVYVLAGKKRSYAFQVDACVLITDNDGGEAALTLPAARPGATAESCLIVTYHGTMPASVRLHGATTGSGLDAHLRVEVTRGTLPLDATFGSCQGFVADAADHAGLGAGVIFRGSLTEFPDSYETGLADPTADAPEVWEAGEAHAYRLTVELGDDDAAQGLTAEQTFLWEARA